MTYEVEFLRVIGPGMSVDAISGILTIGTFPFKDEMEKLKNVFRVCRVFDRSLGFSESVVWDSDREGSKRR